MSYETTRYQDQLLSTSEQLGVLRAYNQRYWHGHFSEADLAALDVTGRLPSLDDVPVIHAEFGTAWDTLEAWQKVYLSYETAHWNTLPDGRRDFDDYVRQHAQTARYEPGLHIVHMDLTRDENTYRDMHEVYAAAEETPGLLLAHSEVLALVGLHRVFRESPDGFARRKTPYLPGYQARNVFVPDAQAGDWDWVTRLDHSWPNNWGIRMFPTKGAVGLNGAVPFVHGDTKT